VATTLYDLLPRDRNISGDGLLGRFLDYVAGRGLTLYPTQEEAILELFEEKNVILSAPNGSGKSLGAGGAIVHQAMEWPASAGLTGQT
jgi:replicative superfamily II helicase